MTSTAEEVAAAAEFYDIWTSNETEGQKDHAKARSTVFSVMQYRVHPESGVTLMTQEQWDGLVSELEQSGLLDRHAAIWHDLDELPDGTLKPLHFHGVVRLLPGHEKQVRYIAKRLKVPASRVRTPKDSYANGQVVTGRLAADVAFFDFCEYLVHENESSREQGKHQYPRDEVAANFDFSAFLDAGRPAKAKNQRRRLSDVDVLALKVQEEGLSLRAARKEDPLAYSRGLDRLRKARGTFLSHAAPPAMRTNYYLGGPSETGKTALARLFARMLYPGLPPEECYFEVGSEMVALQAYDGQPVVIWDDYRAVSLLHALKDRGTVWRVFDTSPGRAQVNIKNGAVGMVQAVNIVTGVAPYAQFLDALAGTYKAADGTEHQAEDSTQAWRRFPFVGEVTKEQILLYANQGFAGLGEYRDYQHIITTRANMRTVMQTIEGIEDPEAREQFRMEMGDRMLGAMVAAHRDARPQRTLTIEQARAALEGEVVTISGEELARQRAAEQGQRDGVIRRAAAMAQALDAAQPGVHHVRVSAGDVTVLVGADGRPCEYPTTNPLPDGIQWPPSGQWVIEPPVAQASIEALTAAGLWSAPSP